MLLPEGDVAGGRAASCQAASASATWSADSHAWRPEIPSTPPTSVLANWSHQRASSPRSVGELLAQVGPTGGGRLLLQAGRRARRARSISSISSSTRWSWTLFSTAGNRLNWPPKPRMFQGSTSAPHSIARCRRSSISGSSAAAASSSAAIDVRWAVAQPAVDLAPHPRRGDRDHAGPGGRPPRCSPSGRTAAPGGRAATARPGGGPASG